jgi:Mg/Co/Ni transporter MgtE
VIARCDFANILVVDDAHKMLDVITFGDIVDVIAKEAAEDNQRFTKVFEIDLDRIAPFLPTLNVVLLGFK